MMRFRRGRRFAALAAMFAITLQALWPLLSHARPGGPSLLVPVCTVEGVTHYLEIKAGRTTPLEERSASHGEHCKLCVLGDGNAFAVFSLDLSAFLPAGHAIGETAKPAEPLREATHLPAQPRAPPQSS
jgi:hypothetical protein